MSDPRQLELPLGAGRPAQPALSGSRSIPQASPPAQRLALIRGEGQPRPTSLHTRDDLARVLLGAAGDMLVKRISASRAHEIEGRVERLMELFDRVGAEPLLQRVLRRELDDLEALLHESARARPPRKG